MDSVQTTKALQFPWPQHASQPDLAGSGRAEWSVLETLRLVKKRGGARACAHASVMQGPARAINQVWIDSGTA